METAQSTSTALAGATAQRLFDGPGEMRARCRALDWGATALGPVSTWPEALKSAVKLTLDSGFPMAVHAGPHQILLYNDAKIAALGERNHPWALGRPVREGWPDMWEELWPMYRGLFAGGPAINREDQPFAIERAGRRDTTYWTFALSPIRGEDGHVVGLHSVGMETTAHVQAESALRKAHVELARRAGETRRALLRQLATAEEEERRRISRELHDGLGQEITVLALQFAALRSALASDPAMSARLFDIERQVRRIDEDVDFYVWQLRPTALDDLGLVEALRDYIGTWTRHSRIDTRFDADAAIAKALTPEINVVVYRIVQEALNNVLKHSRASRVAIAIARDDGHLRIAVEDDGVGLPPASGMASSGFGIAGMRERAALVGGQVDIGTEPGGGTRVSVHVPLARE